MYRILSGWIVAGALVAHTSAFAAETSPFSELESAGTRAVETLPQSEGANVLLSGGTVFTADGDVYAPGYVLLRNGRIESVGAEPPEQLPDEVVSLDVSGRFVTPGLIDTHSHLGVYPSPSARAHSDGNEATSPTTPDVWAEHSFWPQDPGLQRAVAGGITALQILPGSANLIGGRGVVLQMVPARGPRAMRFPGAPETVKMACGENPKRVYGERGGPSTRMGNIAGQRAVFIKAARYLEEWRRWAKKHAKANDESHKKSKKGSGSKPAALPPQRSLEMETLAGVLEGKILPQIHCYRADDMLSMMQIADEFGFKIRSFHHALEAYKIRDLLAEHDISSSTWADWWGFKMEAYDGIPYNAGMLTEAGARAVIHSDSAVGIQRLNQEAAKALQSAHDAGITITDDQAMQWITKHPAWSLGILEQTGTLEPGKRGDIVVWDKHPFSVYASADLVWVDGVLRYDRAQPQVWSDFELGREDGQ